MNSNAITFGLNETFLKDSLKSHFSFERSGVSSIVYGGTNTAYVPDLAGSAKGIIVSATGANSGAAISAATGSNGFLQFSESGNFTKSAVKISGDLGVHLNNMSSIVEFEILNVSDGVLFGGFKKRVDSYNGEDYESSNGFNFGLTSRGHLFFQGFSDKGEYVHIASDIELAKKNIISFSVGGGEVEICRFDYLNGEIQSQKFPTKTSLILDSDSIYLGAANEYFRTSSGVKNFSGIINHAMFFSGKKSADSLYSVGSGLVSDYYFSSGSVSSEERITGYSSTPLIEYYTGITGYISAITGYKSIPSGDPVFSTLVSGVSSGSVKEGERFFITGAGWIEQQGYLNPSLFGSYEPTGDGAEATKGLSLDSASKTVFELSTTSGQTYVSVPLYGVTGLTGVLERITGYDQSPLVQTILVTGQPSSGILLSGDSSFFKKDYIYFLGPR